LTDVLVALGVRQEQRLQARVQDERRDRVHELHLEELDRGHVGEQHAPRVAVAEVDLLQVLVEATLGEERLLRGRSPRAAVGSARAPRRA
jgi:hypothetical protein